MLIEYSCYCYSLHFYSGASSSEWLFHTRPMISPACLSLSTTEKLLQPLNELQTASKLPIGLKEKEQQQQGTGASGGSLTHSSHVHHTPPHFTGMPILRYTIGMEAI